MKLNLKYTIEDRTFILDVTDVEITKINDCLWILLHTLRADRVEFIMEGKQ